MHKKSTLQFGLLLSACFLVITITFLVFSGREPISRIPNTNDGHPITTSRTAAEYSLVPGDSAPQDHRFVTKNVTDERLKSLVDSSLPVSKRLSPELYTQVFSIADAEDMRVLAGVLMDSSDDDTVRNEIANLLHRSKYPGLTHALLQVLENPDEKPRFRSFAVQHLWQQLDGAGIDDQDRIRAKLHELLADRHVEVRREALLALVRMRDPVGITTAIGWLTSLEPSAETTRDLAIRCVYDLGLREQMPVIRPFTRNSNEVTRIAAIVVLSQWGDEESREAFKDAADSSSIRLQRVGKAALERLDQQARQAPMASTKGAPKELPAEDAK